MHTELWNRSVDNIKPIQKNTLQMNNVITFCKGFKVPVLCINLSIISVYLSIPSIGLPLPPRPQ